MTTDPWLEERFNLYANHLSMFPKVEIRDTEGNLYNVRDTYVCPLCLRPYLRQCLYLPIDHKCRLTPEHVPPEGVGGTKMTITCRSCNTLFGGRIDGELVKSMKPLPEKQIVRVSIDNHEVGARFRLTEERKVELEVEPGLSRPDERSNFWESMHKRAKLKQSAEMHIKFRLPYKDTRRRAALFKSAYLLLFHYFGYCYALSMYNPALVAITRFVIDPDSKPDFGYNAVRSVEQQSLPMEANSVFLIREPKKYAGYAVLLRLLGRGTEHHVLVYMPAPGQELPDVFHDDSDQLLEELQFTGDILDMKFLASGGILKDPQMIYYARRLPRQ